MAEEKGKRPSKQQVNDIGSDLGIDLANAIGKAITTTLRNFDFGVLNKNLTKGLGTIDVSKALKLDSNKLKQLATDAKNAIEKSIGTISTTITVDATKVNVSEIDNVAKSLKQLNLQAAVTQVDTSLVSEEVAKLNPITLQAVIQQPQQTAAQPQAQPQPQLIDNAQLQTQAVELSSTIASAVAKGFEGVNLANVLDPLKSSMNGVLQLLGKIGKEMGINVNAPIKAATQSADNFGKRIDNVSENLTGIGGRTEGASEIVNVFSTLNDELDKVVGKSLNLGRTLNAPAQSQKQILALSQENTEEIAKRNSLADQFNKYSRDALELAATQLRVLGAESMTQSQLAEALADRYITTSKIIDLQEDLADSAADYAREIRQSGADIIIKDLTRRLNLSEQEVSQRARLLYMLNEQRMVNGDLTEDQQEQIKLNGGLTDEQVKQLKNEDKLLKHKREQVEIVESLASWQLQLNEELEEYGKSWEKLKSKVRAVVSDPQVFKTFLTVKGIETIKEKLEEGAEVFSEFRKEGLTMTQALGKTTSAIGAAFSFTGVGMKDAAEIQGAMLKEMGSMKDITSDTVAETGKLAKTFGLSNEAAGKLVAQMQNMPGATKETAMETFEYAGALAKAANVAPGAVMESIANNAEATAMYAKDGGKNIATAAVAAKKLGLEFGTITKMADNLLDFENSLNKQLEASVLLGREINLDKARELALNGDLVGATKEMLANVGGEAEFNKMNHLQRKALADAMGVSVQELSKMVKHQDELANLTEEQQEALAEGASMTDVLAANAGGFLEKIKDAGLGFIGMMGSVSTLSSGLKDVGEILNLNVLKGVTGMVRGMAGAVLQAGLFLAKMIAIGTVKLFGGSEQQLEKVKNFFGKEGAAGKFVDKVKGKKPELVGDADKASEVSDKASKASEKTKAVQPGKGLKEFFTNLAAGLKAMGDGKVLFGAFNLIAAAPGLLIMSPVALVAKLIEKVDGKKLKESLSGIANGIKAFGEGKVLFGAVAMTIAAPALLVLSVGAVGAALIQKLVDGKKIKDSLSGIASGVSAFGSGKVLMGGIAMLVASPGLIAIALASIPLALVGALGGGKLIEKALQGIAKGVEYMGNGKVLQGAVGLAVVGLALIPAAYAFKMIGDVDPVAMIAFAGGLTIIGLATALLGSLGNNAIKGAIAMGILGIALIPAAFAFSLLKDVDPIAMIAFAGGLTVLGLAAALLGSLGPMAIMGAAALGILSLALIPAAFAFSLLKGVSTESIIAFSVALPLLGLAAAGLGLISPLIAAGALAMGILGVSMLPVAAGLLALQEAQTGIVVLQSLIQTMNEAGPGIALGAVGFGILAFSLTALGTAALYATPGLLMLSLLLPPIGAAIKDIGEGVKTATDGLVQLITNAAGLDVVVSGLQRMAAELENVASAGTTALPVLESLNSLAGGTAGGGEGGQAAGNTQQEDKMDILIGKIDQIIAMASKPGIVNIDGRKLTEFIRLGVNATNIG